MKEYHKLVRDAIPEIIKNKGENVTFHIATEAEFETALINKLQEEVIEFTTAPSIEELADIMEVVEAYLEFKKISTTELKKVQTDKKAKRGGFSKRIILETTD